MALDSRSKIHEANVRCVQFPTQVVELGSLGEAGGRQVDSPVYVCVSDFSGWPLVGNIAFNT